MNKLFPELVPLIYGLNLLALGELSVLLNLSDTDQIIPEKRPKQAW